MQQFLRPLAKIAGMKSRAKQSRFMEQTYTAIYFAILGPYGLYVMSRTPVWYFNVTGMFEGFPHKTLQAEFKFYYLFQASYWAQQAIVLCLGLEKPRKDFKELVAHHIVTLCLVLGSYGFHFTYMGIGVFITHDLSDFFFAVSHFNPYRLASRLSLTRVLDRKDPQLHRPSMDRPILWLFYLHVDLPSTLPEPYHPTIRVL